MTVENPLWMYFTKGEKRNTAMCNAYCNGCLEQEKLTLQSAAGPSNVGDAAAQYMAEKQLQEDGEFFNVLTHLVIMVLGRHDERKLRRLQRVKNLMQ
jgi:hypothetical protein